MPALSASADLIKTGVAASHATGALADVVGRGAVETATDATAVRSIMKLASGADATAFDRTLEGLSSTGFEQVVANALKRQGFEQVVRTGGAGDLGADVFARIPDTGGRLIAQVKHYAPDGRPITSPDIQRFVGAIHIHDAERGVYVTSSRFTAEARALAADQHIALIDGSTLKDFLQARDGAALLSA